MSHYDLTGPAQRDLGEIAEYITDREVARTQLRRFLDAFDRLAGYPGMGRSQAHRRPKLRSWPVGSYVVFYRPVPDGVEILRVLHGSRDLDNLI